MESLKLIFSFVRPHTLPVFLGIVLALMVVEYSYGDLTFHATKETLVSDSNEKDLYDRQDFPPNSGREVYINRTSALRIPENGIRSIIIRDAPRDPFFDKAMEAAGKQRGREYSRLTTYEVVFRLKTLEGKKLNAFAKLHDRQTFAVRFRNLLLSIPTFVGSFESDDFALIGMTETDIDQLRRLYPSLTDERKTQK